MLVLAVPRLEVSLNRFNRIVNSNFCDVIHRLYQGVLYILNVTRCYSTRKRLRWSRGSVLAFGTQVRVFKVGFFRAKKSSAHLPSEGK